MWSRRDPVKILVIGALGVILVRVVGEFSSTSLADRLVELTDQQPESALFRMIFDFRSAIGVITSETSTRVRDYRHKMRIRIGKEHVPDGPHALISTDVSSVEEIAHSHHELYPSASLCLTSSPAQAWAAVANDAPMPPEVSRFFN
jgi:hypothetical protein